MIFSIFEKKLKVSEISSNKLVSSKFGNFIDFNQKLQSTCKNKKSSQLRKRMKNEEYHLELLGREKYRQAEL